MEPKIIEVPGIPGKLQEMSLDQYLSALSPDHMARKQLDEIRGQALKAVEFSSQLVEAKEKIMDLQNKLILGIAPQPIVPVTTPNISTGSAPAVTVTTIAEDLRSRPFPKVPCPTCGKEVTTSPGGWASHQRSHPDNKAPRPTL